VELPRPHLQRSAADQKGVITPAGPADMRSKAEQRRAAMVARQDMARRDGEAAGSNDAATAGRGGA